MNHRGSDPGPESGAFHFYGGVPVCQKETIRYTGTCFAAPLSHLTLTPGGPVASQTQRILSVFRIPKHARSCRLFLDINAHILQHVKLCMFGLPQKAGCQRLPAAPCSIAPAVERRDIDCMSAIGRAVLDHDGSLRVFTRIQTMSNAGRSYPNLLGIG